MNDKEIVDKINAGFKKRNRAYIFLTLITISLLLPYIPFWFDTTKVEQTFHIGYFHAEKTYINDYRNESAGILVELDIVRTAFKDVQTGDVMFGYMVYTSISMIASENIETIGFSFRWQLHLKNLRVIEHDSESYKNPISNIYFNSGYMMKKGDVCNSTGKVTYHFVMKNDTVVYNETTEYFVDFIIPFDALDYANFSLIIYAILGLYLLFIGLVPFIFNKLIKPTFKVEFDLDDLERERKFKEYVAKKRMNKHS
ncbi:MAG: hypothetical protein EAX91_11115 [Candidatus Lokiarchaeota archaeon]|nr:hypothetical protein [Candidatus Lokiarchaeota archaeon]